MATAPVEGRFRGCSTGPNDFTIGRTSDGVTQVGLVWEIVDGDHEGRRFPKYFTVDDADGVERLKKALRASGWDGVSSLTELKGLGSCFCELVIDTEEWPVASGKVRSRLAFVNPLTQAIMKAPIEGKDRAKEIAKLDGLLRGNGVAPSSSKSSPGDDLPPEAYR